VALVVSLLLIALLSQGRGSERAAASSSAVQLAAADRGPRGPEGPRGPRGPRGPDGALGARGAPGKAAGADRQFISLAWQNGQYAGRDRQSFVAPGIGRGEVQCIPPFSPEGDAGDGRMRIQFFHEDGVNRLPQKWATTMWVTRFGGNADDANRARRSVVKTNRISSGDDNRSSFSESMDTAPIGQHDPESIGSFTGLITTEPFNFTTEQPPPTSFELSWHWNFRNQGSSRCYVSGVFVTAPR
jgi:hypothetical protein